MKWFYSDPLEAAYMGKQYGMEFEFRAEVAAELVHPWEKPGHKVVFCSPDNLYPYASFSILTDHGKAISGLRFQDLRNQFFVHPDSLHLLDVQVGDMVLDSDGINGIAVLLELQLEQCRGAVIIQRDGRPFFYPQSA